MIYMMVVEDGKYILTQKAYQHLIECKGCFGRPFFIFIQYFTRLESLRTTRTKKNSEL